MSLLKGLLTGRRWEMRWVFSTQPAGRWFGPLTKQVRGLLHSVLCEESNVFLGNPNNNIFPCGHY